MGAFGAMEEALLLAEVEGWSEWKRRLRQADWSVLGSGRTALIGVVGDVNRALLRPLRSRPVATTVFTLVFFDA